VFLTGTGSGFDLAGQSVKTDSGTHQRGEIIGTHVQSS